MHRSGLAALLFCFLGTPFAAANNNFFLPGDAFFPTQLTAEDVKALQEGKPEEKVFFYTNLGGYGGYFCGYAGFGRAKIASLDRPFITNLAEAYSRLRAGQSKELREEVRDGRTRLIETNGICESCSIRRRSTSRNSVSACSTTRNGWRRQSSSATNANTSCWAR